MQTAYNPDTGETLVLVDNEWVRPEKIAKNEAGESAYLVNNKWITKDQPSSIGTTAKDIGKLFGAGAIESAAGAPEGIQAAASGAARENTFIPTDILNAIAQPQQLTNKLVGAIGIPPIFEEKPKASIIPESVVKKQREELDKTLSQGKIQSLRNITEAGGQIAKSLEESISPEMKKAMAESQPSGNIIEALDTGDFSKISFGADPSVLGLSGQFAKVFGSTAPIIASSLVTKSAAPAATIGFGQASSEGVADAREHIKKMSDEELSKNSEYFRNLVLLGYDKKTARQLTEDKAADTAALYQGTVGALGGAFTSKLISGKLDDALLASARNKATRIVRGFSAGAAEEGFQELSEGLATDLGIDKTVARKMGADSFANFVLGALGGGGPGGVRAMVAGEKPAVAPKETPAAPSAAPQAAPTSEAPVETAPPSPSMDTEAMLAELLGQPPKAPAAETIEDKAIVPEVSPVEAKPEPKVVPVDEPITKLTKKEEPAPEPVKVEPVKVDRLQDPAVQESLKRYASEAGWSQRGGLLLRENADDNTSAVIGRTQWTPNASWWTNRPVVLKNDGDGRATQKAVSKALAGEKLSPNEKKMVDFLVNMHDIDMTEGDRIRAEMEQQDREIAEFNKQFEVPQTQEEAAATQADQEARIKAQEDADIEAEMAAQAERDRAEIARRSAEQAQSFALGQTPEESLTGQQRLADQDDDIPFFSMERPNAKPYTKQVANNERVLNEKIDELRNINIRRSAINRRFAKDKLKPLDQFEAKSLYEKSKELEDDIESLKWATRNLTAEKFMARATDALAKDEISRDVYDVIHEIFKKNPNLLEGLRLQIKQGNESDGNTNFQTAGEFIGRIVRLYKGTSGTEDPSIVRHELTHSLEQVMSKDAKKKLVQEWRNKLDKAQKTDKSPEAKLFFNALFEHLKNPTRESFAAASNLMPNKSYYQYMSPSEYWAVNAEKLLAANLGGAWTRFRNFVRGLFEAMKNLFGFDNTNTIHRVFNEVIGGKREGTTMLTDLQRGVTPTKAIDVSKNESFKKWFGDSKVVNEDGSPKVVYHGTDVEDFSVFNPASWFSENPKESSQYARPGDITVRERLLNKYKLSDDTSAVGKVIPLAPVLQDFGKLKEGELYAEGGEDGPVYKYLGKNKFEVLKNVVVDLDNVVDNPDGTSSVLLKKGFSQQAIDQVEETKDFAQKEYPGGERGRVYPVYLSIKNPKYLSAMDANQLGIRLGATPESIKKVVDELKSQGYDGIITKSDEASFFPEVREAYGGIPEQYIPFDANQVKSAVGNVGTFKPEEKNITLAMEPKVNKHRNIDGQVVSPVWNSPDVSKVDDLLYKLQDKHIDTKRVVQAIQKEAGQLDDKWNVYLKEELYHGRTSAALRKFLLQDLMPTIKEMARLGITPDEMKEYLHNRHAPERNDQIAKIRPATLPDGSPNPSAMTDKGSGLSYKQVEEYFDKLDPKKAKKLEEVAKNFDKMIAGTQNILVSSGAETQETIDSWNKTYKHYVPLFRVDDDFATHPSQGTGAGFSSSGGASKRATGSEKEVQDILGNILAQRERALIKAEKIRVGQALYGLAIKNPNPEFWLPINPDAVKNQDALAAELDSMGLDGADVVGVMEEMKKPEVVMDRQTGLQTVRYKVNPLDRYKDNVFPVRVNGKDRYIFFNQNDPRAKRMVEAMKNLDTEQLGAIVGTFGKFTRWFSAVNTQYNPVFGGINFLRDLGGAQFNLSTTKIAGKQGAVNAAIFPAMRAIASTLKAERNGRPVPQTDMTKLWDEFKTAGGQTLYRDSLVRKAEEKQLIEHELDRMKRGKIRRAFSGAVQLLSDFNDTIENAVRLAAYKVAVDSGLSKEQAASIAKNLTVNFDRKGQLGSRINAAYAFFNASMQGSARLMETLRGPQGRKIIAGGILLGVAQSLALAMAGFDEDEPPEFLKERNLVIPLGGKKYFLIPMPLGLHFIPTVGRVTTDFVLHGGKNPGKHMASIIGTGLDAFNPLGGAGLSLQTLTPTLLDPLAALDANKDAFGRPIYKADRATNPTPGYLRSREGASTVNKYLAEFLNYASGGTKYQKGYVSPTADALDYLVGQFTGGIGREAMKVQSAVKSAVTGEELPTYRIPIAGRFYGDADSKAADSQRFYDNVTKIAGLENEIKGRRKNREDVAGFMRDNPQARLWQQANNAENQISELNKRKKEFQERGLPKDRILAIENQKQVIMRRFNDRVKALEE